MNMTAIKPWEGSSDQCLARLADLEPIDFFLACELQRGLGGDAARFHLWLALHWALRQGHSCLDLAALAGQTLWAESSAVADAPAPAKPGVRFGELAVLRAALDGLDLDPAAGQALVREGDRLYLRRYWNFERELAASLGPRLQPLALEPAQRAAARAALAQLFPHAPLNGGAAEPVDWQAVAVANALARRFCILSGGPGTGKTYTVTRLLAALQALAGGTLRMQMAAPTGKAKQRLQESIGAAKAQLQARGFDRALLAAIPEQAHTLHGLLGVRPNSTQLRHHAAHPLPLDLLLIDEASMVDLPMMTRVLRALPPAARLILVGDANQLPSIAVGSVLADLAPLPHAGYSTAAVAAIEALSGYRLAAVAQGAEDAVCHLRHSHRFDGSGGIGQLAAAVIGLDADAGWQQLQAAALDAADGGAGQLGWVAPAQQPAWLAEAVTRHFQPIAAAPDLAGAFARLAAFRLLVPTRVGEQGVEALNRQIETQLARRNPTLQPGHHYHGRPIMITRNHQGLGLFNGDVGLLWRNAQGVLEACFEQEGGIRRVNPGLLPPVESVYAMTIHKTQGSEFGQVALLLPDQAARLLSPELIYTGITRARRRCVVLCGERLWRAALAQRARRWSGLRQRL